MRFLWIFFSAYLDNCYHIIFVALNQTFFVSYADFPPILGVEAPKTQDFGRWYKRWKGKTAPDFWTQFYAHQFKNARSNSRQLAWGRLVAEVKSLLSNTALKQLRDAYAYEKYWRKNV